MNMTLVFAGFQITIDDILDELKSDLGPIPGKYSTSQHLSIYQTVLTAKLRTILSKRGLTSKVTGPINSWYLTVFL